MIFCKKCGRYYNDGMASCVACGANLRAEGQSSFQGVTVTTPGVTVTTSSRSGAAARMQPIARPKAPLASPKASVEPAVTARARETQPDSKSNILFDRDKFLLRQKALAIKEKYYVTDEQGMPLMFVERPALLLQQITMLAGVAAAFFGGVFTVSFVSGFFAGLFSVRANSLFAFVGFIAVLALTGYVFVLLVPKRHVTFYADDSKGQRLLEIKQLNKVEFPYANFTILDTAGAEIGKLRKNILFDYIRRRWYVMTSSGLQLFTAKEDSILLSLIRRTVFRYLRTNFIFLRGNSVIGEFNRKMTILDRYVLDMTADPLRTIDRRIALAVGVMLDTGEHR